jgi:MinD-like ATPase involved in chromosome partitioning or flagellar assembly
MDVVIAAGGATWEEAALREVESSSVLRLARRCVDVADLLAVAHTDLASAAIVSDDLAGLDVDAVARLEQAGVRVATVDPAAGRAEALGIRRVLRLGDLDEIAHDVWSQPQPVATRRAPSIAVWGPAGAPGRSTVALGLASSAAARGVDTVLVDADTYGGTLGQLLSVLDDVSGLVAACRAVNNGRPGEVADHVLDIDPSLRLLTGLPRADMWAQVRPSALQGVLDELRQRAGLIVVDVGAPLEPATGAGPSRNQTAVQVVESADAVVVVGRPDPVGLSRLVRAVHDLAAVAPDVRPVVAVNMMRSSLGWNEREVRATVHRLTGIEPVVHLPYDRAGLDLAVMSGRTPREAVPSSPFVARIEVLTSHLLGSVAVPQALAGSRH